MVDHPLINEQLQKYAREPMKKGMPDWSLNSRNLIAACLFGPMGAPIPRGNKDKIPSIAAPVLEKITHPFAAVLKEYRSSAHTLTSIKSSIGHVREAEVFGQQGGPRVRIIYNIVNYGNVERIFTPASESLPISADKRVRYAIGDTNPGTVKTADLDPSVVTFLPTEEVFQQGEVSV